MAAATFLPGAAATAADEPPLPSESIAASRLDLDGQRCVVRLHGKSGGGQETYADGDGVLQIAPDGNADGWGGRQWLYFPDDRYDEARDVVAAAIEDCDAVILDGFSNGAAFVAKVFCRGETFEGRLIRVVIDDPVPDAGVTDCAPAEGVDAVLYWTGGLAETAQPGWDCGEGDWT